MARAKGDRVYMWGRGEWGRDRQGGWKREGGTRLRSPRDLHTISESMGFIQRALGRKLLKDFSQLNDVIIVEL